MSLEYTHYIYSGLWQITMYLSDLALTGLHAGIWHAFTFTRYQHGILAESLPYL